MLASTMSMINAPKTPFLSTPFLPSNPLLHLQKPIPNVHSSKPASISSLILPNSPNRRKPGNVQDLILPPSSRSGNKFSSSGRPSEQLYQPYRPPSSPLPPHYRNLDINSRLQILTDRLGLWYEYAPLLPSLYQEGFSSPIIEEITGISGIEQNRIIVAAQVRDSLIECEIEQEVLSAFDLSGAELLYELRNLEASQRVAAARYLVANEFDGKRTEELSRAIKDMPRRKNEKGWSSFDSELPGDCLAFVYYRLAYENRATNDLESWRHWMERALETLQSEDARSKVAAELEGKVEAAEDLLAIEPVKVPVVRMKIGEVAEATSVAVIPVCRAEDGAVEVADAPWESRCVGDFGIVEAEKGWSRWVVLPKWVPVAVLSRGGVAVAFKDSKILPWKAAKWNRKEAIVVVADRSAKEVVAEDGFYLVVGGGNGSGEEGLKVERGLALMENGVKESLGTVVLVIRPPREENDQLRDEDWD